MIAFGGNDLLHEEIDRIYNHDKLRFYGLYKNSSYFNCPVFSRYTIYNEEAMKKVAGILVHDATEKTNLYTYMLIKKGYRHVWNYIKGRKNIVAEEFANYMIKRKGGLLEISEYEMLFDTVVLFFLCTEEDIPLNLNSPYGETIIRALKQINLGCSSEMKNYSSDAMEKYQEKVEALYLHYGIDFRKEITAENLLEKIINKDILNLVKEKDIYNTPLEARGDVFHYATSKYIGAFSGWVKSLGIDETDITRMCKLTRADVSEIFLEYFISQEKNKIEEKNKNVFIMACLFIKVLTYEYKRTKDKYINNLHDDFFYDISKMKDDVERREKDIKEKEAEFVSAKDKLQQENCNLMEEIKRLQKQNETYKKELESIQNNNKEVFALREYLFSLQGAMSDVIIEEADMQKMIDIINAKKCVILGGSPNWLNKIKEVLPSVITITTDKLSLDMKFIDNAEFVMLNTATMSHAFYMKVMSKVAKANAKLVYLNSNSNIKMSIKNIYDEVTKE